jgi:uncharacterized membrane protein YeaQ/YmgE (transglycosylase-associated protein family)
MDMLNLVLSLLSGAAGGNVAGKALGDKSLGTVGNTVSGLIGGGLGDFALKALGVLASSGATATAAATATGDSSFDMTSLLINVGVSALTGGGLTGIVGVIKDAILKK